jgi:hypothetical protein
VELLSQSGLAPEVSHHFRDSQDLVSTSSASHHWNSKGIHSLPAKMIWWFINWCLWQI